MDRGKLIIRSIRGESHKRCYQIITITLILKEIYKRKR